MTALERVSAAPASLDDLHAAIEAADAQREQLYLAGDLDALASGLAPLRELVKHLQDLARNVEANVAELMPAKTYELDGVGVLERRKGTDRRSWEWETLWPALVRRVLDPEGTGELPPLPTTVATLTSLTEQVIGLTPSKQPRLGALRDLGFDPDEWCQSSPGKTSVQIHGGAS